MCSTAHYNVAFSSNSEWVCPSQVLLSPPIVVYSPRVLPVYVYDAHADSAKNVRYRYVLSYATYLPFLSSGLVICIFLSVLSHPKVRLSVKNVL